MLMLSILLEIRKTFEQVFNPFQSSVISIRSQSIDMHCKSTGWLLFDDNLKLKRVKSIIKGNNSVCLFL